MTYASRTSRPHKNTAVPLGCRWLARGFIRNPIDDSAFGEKPSFHALRSETLPSRVRLTEKYIVSDRFSVRARIRPIRRTRFITERAPTSHNKSRIEPCPTPGYVWWHLNRPNTLGYWRFVDIVIRTQRIVRCVLHGNTRAFKMSVSSGGEGGGAGNDSRCGSSRVRKRKTIDNNEFFVFDIN